MFNLFRRNVEFRKNRILPPADGSDIDDYVSLPMRDLEQLVIAYVEAMEVQRTTKWCRCEWRIHPDDMELPKGKRRLRRGEPDATCPVHTKEGFLLYFFEWVFNRG